MIDSKALRKFDGLSMSRENEQTNTETEKKKEFGLRHRVTRCKRKKENT